MRARNRVLPSTELMHSKRRAIGRPSHGTATTMVENLHKGGSIRRNGVLTKVPAAWQVRSIDFGRGPTTVMSIPWGDVATAYHSTGIPNIEVYMAAPAPLRVMSRVARYLPGLMRSAAVQNFFKGRIDAGPSGPNAEQRKNGRSFLWGEVRNAAGKTASARLETLEGYTLTSITAWDIACRVVRDQIAQPGFRTPSTVFGPDYILGLTRTTRTDL